MMSDLASRRTDAIAKIQAFAKEEHTQSADSVDQHLMTAATAISSAQIRHANERRVGNALLEETAEAVEPQPAAGGSMGVDASEETTGTGETAAKETTAVEAAEACNINAGTEETAAVETTAVEAAAVGAAEACNIVTGTAETAAKETTAVEVAEACNMEVDAGATSFDEGEQCQRCRKILAFRPRSGDSKAYLESIALIRERQKRFEVQMELIRTQEKLKRAQGELQRLQACIQA